MLPKYHDGLRKGFSAWQWFLTLLEKWKNVVYRGKVVVASLTSLRKTFDFVNQEFLITEWNGYAFALPVLTLFHNYALNKRCYIKINHVYCSSRLNSMSSFVCIYSVSLLIQSECGKIQTRKTPHTDTFRAVWVNVYSLYVLYYSPKERGETLAAYSTYSVQADIFRQHVFPTTWRWSRKIQKVYHKWKPENQPCRTCRQFIANVGFI